MLSQFDSANPTKTKTKPMKTQLSKRQISLINHLIKGKKLSIYNAFTKFGISNISREVGRLIEKPFNIQLKREKKVGKTQDGEPCYWFEYSATGCVKKKLEKLV